MKQGQSYKKKYKELKRILDVDKKIEHHRKNYYIHIPFSWGFIGRLFSLVGSVLLVFLNFRLIILVGEKYEVWMLLKNPQDSYHSFTQLIILYPIVLQYLLFSLFFICFVALVKGGFDKIKDYKEQALIFGIILGLIGGLIGGLVGGLVFVLIFGIILGLIGGLILGFVVCY